MANHETALNALLNIGLRQRGLENVLASNCVLDWFGRTISGRSKIINYYLNLNNCYEHSLSNAETVEPFEERDTHLSTRDQPLDNLHKPPEFNKHEQWYDCETHSPVNLKDPHKTPPQRQNLLQKCPPAPCRQVLMSDSSDDEISSLDDGFGDDIRPLDDGSFKSEEIPQSPESKRQRLNETKTEKKKTQKTISADESRYSELKYFEASGSVTVLRQASTSSSGEEGDRRECKLQISYRTNRENPNDIQIALIVYKCNSSNLKSRRNLMLEFKDDVDTSVSNPIVMMTPPIQRQSTTEEKIIHTAPPDATQRSKATKRSISSRNCLRF